jgi:tetratricopeptide (TPR) repeat protein
VTAIRVAIVLALVAGTAAAQNDRYPAEPEDKDKEAEGRSDFWERALEPARGSYDQLLAQARRLVDARTPLDRKQAIELLDAAIAKLPSAPDAYFLRGWAHENAEDWAKCADDYVAAHARDPDYALPATPRKLGGLLHAMGVCLARADRLEEAESALAQLAASGKDSNAADTWLRLGEVYMAQGRLDDAITALTRAIDNMPNGDLVKTIRWLRAVAYDRARLPKAAAEDAAEAAKTDPSMIRALSPILPYVPAEERYYVAGIAADARVLDAQGNVTRAEMPERALINFREYLRRAPESRWRRRAEEHVAALRDYDPTRVFGERRNAISGSAAIAVDKARAVVRRELPALERCMKDVPAVVLEVTVTIVGAAAKPSKAKPKPKRKPVANDEIILWSPYPYDRGFGVMPQAGVTTRVIEGSDDAASAGAQKCVQQAAAGIKLKLERGTYTRWTFPVLLR